MKISAVFDRVNDLLTNSGYVTWSEDFLRRSYVEGMTALLTALPTANVETADLPLVAGTLQASPEGVSAILGFVCNVSAAGAVKKPVAERGDMGLFNAERAYLADYVVAAITYQVQRPYIDPMDPSSFYVLPPVPAGYTGKLRVRCAVRPPIPAWGGDPDFPLREGFELAIMEYMLWRAFGRADENTPDATLAAAHKAACDAELHRLGQLLGVPVAGLSMTRGTQT